MFLFALLLFGLVLSLALYDWHTCQVPNLITLPLLVIALTWHFPGTPAQWVGSLGLFAAWYGQALGGGDAKLWIALLWLTPPALAATGLTVMASVLMATAVGQLAWRACLKKRVLGVKSPGAWRAIPFTVWLLWVGNF